jgi:hypothetical protein
VNDRIKINYRKWHIHSLILSFAHSKLNMYNKTIIEERNELRLIL